jgi:hypothetical protein
MDSRNGKIARHSVSIILILNPFERGTSVDRQNFILELV